MSSFRTVRSRADERSPYRLFLDPLEERVAPAVLLDPLSQPRFVNPLPNPLADGFVFRPTGMTETPEGRSAALYEIGIHQFRQRLGLKDPVTGADLWTTVWGYGDVDQPQTATYPGRTFVANRDDPVVVRWTNQLVDDDGNPLSHLLPVDSTLHWADPLGSGHQHGPYLGPVPVVTHLHGGHTRSDSDGLPDAWFTPDSNDPDSEPDYTGDLYNPVYTYDNDQQAATLWYHDHALGVTRLNVYAGLAGFYILRDGVDTGVADDPLTPENENPSGLPTGPYEVPLVIQDRMFTEDGQLVYPSEPEVPGAPEVSVLPEFFGNFILVNGQAWPVMDVEPTGYRLRLLNGSDSRFYTMWIDSGSDGSRGGNGPAVFQVGTDSGLLYSPVPLDKLTLGPGERADVVVDFTGWEGQTLILRNNARSPFPKGMTVDPRTTGQIMAFRVGSRVTTPQEFDPGRALRETPIDPTRDFGTPA